MHCSNCQVYCEEWFNYGGLSLCRFCLLDEERKDRNLETLPETSLNDIINSNLPEWVKCFLQNAFDYMNISTVDMTGLDIQESKPLTFVDCFKMESDARMLCSDFSTVIRNWGVKTKRRSKKTLEVSNA